MAEKTYNQHRWSIRFRCARHMYPVARRYGRTRRWWHDLLSKKREGLPPCWIWSVWETARVLQRKGRKNVDQYSKPPLYLFPKRIKTSDLVKELVSAETMISLHVCKCSSCSYHFEGRTRLEKKRNTTDFSRGGHFAATQERVFKREMPRIKSPALGLHSFVLVLSTKGQSLRC